MAVVSLLEVGAGAKLRCCELAAGGVIPVGANWDCRFWSGLGGVSMVVRGVSAGSAGPVFLCGC
eukprot:106248-Alexandrium_andersonii.AAC.1